MQLLLLVKIERVCWSHSTSKTSVKWNSLLSSKCSSFYSLRVILQESLTEIGSMFNNAFIPCNPLRSIYTWTFGLKKKIHSCHHVAFLFVYLVINQCGFGSVGRWQKCGIYFFKDQYSYCIALFSSKIYIIMQNIMILFISPKTPKKQSQNLRIKVFCLIKVFHTWCAFARYSFTT